MNSAGWPLPIEAALLIGVQVASGLAAIHARELIHRDLKPANILIERYGERVKITDFGVARAVDDPHATQLGLIAGTPAYMSPEQAGGLSVDHRADLFSLCSVLYALASGRPPFGGKSILGVIRQVCDQTPKPSREVNPAIPREFSDLVAKLHSRKPANRPQAAAQVADELSAMLARNSDPKSTASSGERQRRRFGRGMRLAATVMLFSALALGAAEATGVTDMHSTVIRLLLPEGTLVIEVDDHASFAPVGTISRSTISGNIADGAGGGFYLNTSSLTILNSTISGNTGVTGGAILTSLSNLFLTNVTITQYTTTSPGAAVQPAPARIFEAGNSIIADNTGGDLGTFTVMRYRGQKILSGDPKLGPLADNGGPTLTHKPLSGSPALMAVISAVSLDSGGNPILTDQRGWPRSLYQPTIGAVEGSSMTVITNPLDLGTLTYGQTSTIVPVEIAGYEVDQNMLASSDQGARLVEFSHDLQNWSSWCFYVLPKSLFVNSNKVTIYARIAPGAKAGSISGNFGFSGSLSTASVTYSGTVNPARLTYLAKPASKTYGDSNPAFTGSVTGLVLNQTMDSVVTGTPQFSSTATAASGKGQYAIDGSGLTLINPNYVLAQAPGNATALTISARTLAVKALDATKIQGEADPGFTVSYDGFVMNDGPGSLGGSLEYWTAATSASLPGLNSVTPGGLISNNYDFQYVSGTLSMQSYATASGYVLSEVSVATLNATMKQALSNTPLSAIQSFNAGQTSSGMDQLRLFIDLINRRDRSFPNTLALRWIAAATRIRRAWNPNL